MKIALSGINQHQYGKVYAPEVLRKLILSAPVKNRCFFINIKKIS